MIVVKDVTMAYPSGKGIFDINFEVKEGSSVGYLGPNGAGKTTTIRQLLGFMKPDKGSCSIQGLDCFTKASEVQKIVGYVPGEIAFLEGIGGDEYLKYIAEVRGIKDTKRQKELIDMFEFSPKGNVKKFSKGMKQKLGIVSAFMHNPEVIILDEPTSGLDPLMQNRFVQLVTEEKKKGKTILISSHIFEEVERTCDNVLIIKDGRLVTNASVSDLKANQRKCFSIKTTDDKVAKEMFETLGFDTANEKDELEVYVTGDNLNVFTKALGNLTLTSFDVKSQLLEDVFMHFYAKEGK